MVKIFKLKTIKVLCIFLLSFITLTVIVSEKKIHRSNIEKQAYSVDSLTNEQLKSVVDDSTKKLMIVAHPDDEVIWGCGHLMSGDYLVVCITNGKNEVRAKEFADVEGSDKMIESSAKLLADCGLDTCTVEEINDVDGGEGYVISTTGIGFAKSAPIQIVIGIKDNKRTGYAVVSHMDTPGYGAACEEEPFAGQFAGKDAAVLGADEVDAISGATFTTTGITNAVNAAIVFYQTKLLKCKFDLIGKLLNIFLIGITG